MIIRRKIQLYWLRFTRHDPPLTRPLVGLVSLLTLITLSWLLYPLLNDQGLVAVLTSRSGNWAALIIIGWILSTVIVRIKMMENHRTNLSFANFGLWLAILLLAGPLNAPLVWPNPEIIVIVFLVLLAGPLTDLFDAIYQIAFC